MPPTLLTVPEAAERLRISPWSLYELRKAGKVSAVKLGKRFLFTEEALEHAVRAAEQPAGEPAA